MVKPDELTDPHFAVDQQSDVPGAQALLRGLDLLLAIGTSPKAPRFKDLEKRLGIPRASLHRLLAALASRGLVRYDSRRRTYEVGMRVLELSRRTLDQSAIIRAARSTRAPSFGPRNRNSPGSPASSGAPSA